MSDKKRARCFLTETEVRIIKHLYNSTSSTYSAKIESETGINHAVAYDNLKSLRSKGYIISSKEGVEVRFSLTESGEALAWMLENPKDFLKLYQKNVHQ